MFSNEISYPSSDFLGVFLLRFPIALARKAYLLVSAAFVGDSPCKGVAAP